MQAPISISQSNRVFVLPVKEAIHQNSSNSGEDYASSPTFRSVTINLVQKIADEKRVTLDEARETLSKLVKEKTTDQSKKTALVHAIQGQNWEIDPAFMDTEDYPYYALACLAEGSISLEQFSTILFYRTCDLYHEDKFLQPVSLFITDPITKKTKVNPVAKKILSETFAPRSTLNVFLQRRIGAAALTDAQIDKFFEEMEKKELSEQQFFIMPDTFKFKGPIREHKLQIIQNYQPSQKDIDQVVKLSNVSEEEARKKLLEFSRNVSEEAEKQLGDNYKKLSKPLIEIFYQDVGFNPLNFFEEEGKRKRLMPSFTMMQTYLDVKYEKNSVKINPVLGVSPFSAIYNNALDRTREMALPFVNFPLPDTADQHPAPGFDFIYHDFYHASVFALIPQQHVECVLKLMEILEKLKSHEELVHLKKPLEALIEECGDLEGSTYTGHIKGANDNSKYLFWIFLSSIYESFNGKYNLQHEPENVHQGTVNLGLKFADSKFFPLLAQELKKNQEYFLARGIDLKDIHEFAATKKKTIAAQVLSIVKSGVPNYDFLNLLSGGELEKQLLAQMELSLVNAYNLEFSIVLSKQLPEP